MRRLSTLSEEEHRHRCEVRHVLALARRNELDARQYLAMVKRVSARGVRLEQDCSMQWVLGNRGRKGDWR